MTQDEIIEMAKQCGCWNGETCEMNDVGLEAFAKLIEDKVRQDIIEKNAPVIKVVNAHIKALEDLLKEKGEA